MVKNGVFPDSIDTDFIEWLVLEVNAVAAAKNFGMCNALQKLVDQKTPIRACWQAGFLKNS